MSAVLVMRCTASAATSSGPDDAADRAASRAARSRRLVELVAEQRCRQRGVDEAGGDEVDPDRRELEREVAVNGGSAAVAAEISRGPPDLRPPVPPMNSSVPPGRTLPRRSARPRGSAEVVGRARRAPGRSHLGQRRVVRAAGRDHHVVDRRRQVVEELLRAPGSVASKAAVLRAPTRRGASRRAASGCGR